MMLFTDSQVVLGALMKGRSSAKGIMQGCRRAAALSLAYGMTLYCRFVPTSRNHSDGPSRGGPLGVFEEKDRDDPVRFGAWYQAGSTSSGSSLG